MLLRLSLILLALALPASFPAESTQTLRQQYGQPVSEAFLVRPGIVVTATYGPSGKVCELVIGPKESDEMIKKWPGSDTVDYDLMDKIEHELVPKSERGKYKGATAISLFCPPENDCFGMSEDWEKITTYVNSGKTVNAGEKGARYEVIQWKRSECGHKTW
jgi:hypothetical protein